MNQNKDTVRVDLPEELAAQLKRRYRPVVNLQGVVDGTAVAARPSRGDAPAPKV